MQARLSSSPPRRRARTEQAAIVLFTAALHGLVIYSFTAPTPILPPAPAAVSAIHVELALTAAPDTAPTAAVPPASPPEEPSAPPAETPPPLDVLAAEVRDTPPPKPIEKRPVKAPPPKTPVSKTHAPPIQQATANSTDTPAAAPSNLSAPNAAPGETTPASANASHLNNPAPHYPPLALKRKWQGTVQLRVQVLVSGKPGEIQIERSSGRDILDQAAVTAVRQWSFVAARKGGVAMESWASFPLNFKLQ